MILVLFVEIQVFTRYPSGVPTIKSRFGSVTSDYSLDDVMCDGTEQSLQDCKYSSQDNCGRSEGAGVICQGTYWTCVYVDSDLGC